MLVEEEYELGGHLRWGDRHSSICWAELRDEVASQAGIEVLVNSVVTGRYDDNWVAVVQRSNRRSWSDSSRRGRRPSSSHPV